MSPAKGTVRRLPPLDEDARLRALASYDILDTPPEADFDEVALLAARVCDAPIALISLVDAERQWFKARVGLDVTETPRDVGFCAHAIQGPDLMEVPDTHRDPRFAGNPLVLGQPGARFYAGAPLLTPEGAALGTVCVLDRVPRRLSEEQRAALRVLARHIVVCLELRRATVLLQDALAALHASEEAVREKQTFARAVVDALPSHVAVLDASGTIVDTNEAWQEFARENGAAPAAVGRGQSYLLECDRAAGRGSATAAAFGQGLREVMAAARPRFSLEYDCHSPEEQRWFVGTVTPFGGPRAEVAVTHVDVTQRRLAEEEMRSWSERLERRVAERTAQLEGANRALAAEAAQRAAAEEALRRLSRRVLTAQEEERRRIARELHDEIGQVLTAVNMGLQRLRRRAGPQDEARIAEHIDAVDRAIDEVRRLALDLRPSLLDDLGLAAALRWYVDRQVRESGLVAHLALDLGGRLPAEVETAAFRVVQEALTNVLRHARASHVWVKARRGEGFLELSVKDDGVGVGEAGAPGLGLAGMRERVALLNGSLDLVSRPGRGTDVRASIPLGSTAGAET